MAKDIAYANLNTIAASIGPKYVQGKIEDIFFDAHPFFEMIKANGNIKKDQGTGKSLVLNIRVGSNSTVGNRSTDEVVPLAGNETNTTAEWPWGSITGSLSFNDSALHDNMGKAELVDILQVGMDQLIDTWVERMSRNILTETSADSPFQFLGLKDGVSDGTRIHPASYGGLTPANYSTWAAYVKDNGTTQSNLVESLNNCFNTASFSRQQPDILVSDQRGEEIYRSYMDTNIRYTDTKTGDGTINAVVFRGKPLIFDRELTDIEATPTAGSNGGLLTWSGTLDTASTHRYYLLNSKTWEFHFDSQWNMDNAVEKGWRIPVDQFKRSKLMCIRGQFITKQRKYNSVLVNVPD